MLRSNSLLLMYLPLVQVACLYISVKIYFTSIILTAPVDYTSTSRTLTFGPSTTSQSVNIPINNDDVVETVENFIASLTLGTEDANVVINPARTTVSINDNDGTEIIDSPLYC